jgi:chorismate mutase
VDPLSLDNIRNVLTRLEETIIFGLIERAQYGRNDAIYVKVGVGRELKDESLLEFLLHECERSHSKVRRYTSPDEHPFFNDLPAPILPALDYASPLRPNTININPEIFGVYVKEIVPFICPAGDDRQYGSSAVNDVTLLQALSKRIHYGKFVAETKFRAHGAELEPLIRAQDRAALLAAITDADVERQILERVRRKAATYGAELEAGSGQRKVDPEAVVAIYSRWIIPLNKKVQVLYLLQRA